MELRETTALLDGILREQGIGKYTYTLSESEKQELNIENGGFKLLRTVFGKAGSLKVFTDGRMGSASGNDLTEAGLRKLAGAAKTAAESASEDPCHDIAPDQGKEVFRQGNTNRTWIVLLNGSGNSWKPRRRNTRKSGL